MNTFASPSWPGSRVGINGRTIHYYRTGERKVPMILNHGVTDDGLCWSMTARALESEFDLILPDSRGHGFSDSGDGDYGPEARVADLLGLMDALEIKQAILGGHSMGADTALRVAIAHPKRVRCLILEDPPLTLPGQPVFGGMEKVKADRGFLFFVKLLRFYKKAPLPMAKALVRLFMGHYPKDSLGSWLRSKRILSDDLISTLAGSLTEWSSPYSLLDQIEVPSLLFVGNRRKGAILDYPEVMKHLGDHRPITVEYFQEASHDIRRFDHPRFIAGIRHFLQTNRLDEGSNSRSFKREIRS